MPRKQPKRGKPGQPIPDLPSEPGLTGDLDAATIGQQVVAGVLDAAQRLVKKRCTPLAAEAWASQILGMIGMAVTEATSVDRVFVDVLVPTIEESPTPQGLAVLRALAAVGAPDLRMPAADAADRIAAQGVAEQPWAATVGTPTVGEAWVYSDPFGSQESLLISFAYGRKQHAICVLVDHTLGGGIKEAFVVDDVPATLAHIRSTQDAMPELLLAQIDQGEARSRLEQAIRAGECPGQQDQAEDVAATRALLHARLGLLTQA